MAAEGMVLLKNNGALPLSGGRAALYGAGVRHTSFGGTGSGDTHPRRRVTAEEGFLAGGWTVCTGLWLDDYDERMAAARGRWQREVAELIRSVPLTRQSDVAWQHPFVPPEGRRSRPRTWRRAWTPPSMSSCVRPARAPTARRKGAPTTYPAPSWATCVR